MILITPHSLGQQPYEIEGSGSSVDETAVSRPVHTELALVACLFLGLFQLRFGYYLNGAHHDAPMSPGC